MAAAGGVGVVLTHFFGPPKVRPASFPDVDVPAAVLRVGPRAPWPPPPRPGVPAERVVVDPGVGLGKSPEQDLDLLRRIGEIRALGRPVFVPISNKKVIGAVTGAAAKQRLAGTAAGLVWCRAQGATLFRVHNVRFLSRRAGHGRGARRPARRERWHEVVK